MEGIRLHPLHQTLQLWMRHSSGEKGQIAEKHNVLSWEGGHLQSGPHSGHCWQENTPTEHNRDQTFPPCTVAHSCAMRVALFPVSFGHNTSHVIREDPLRWKGWYEYQFQHNLSKCEFHCISGIYYYSDSKFAASLKQTHALAGCTEMLKKQLD